MLARTITKFWFTARISASTFSRRRLFSRTISKNCRISSSRLSFSSLCPRTAVVSFFFSRVSSIRVGFICVVAKGHAPPLLLSVILVQKFVLDTLQLAAGQNGEQLPADIQRFFNIAVGIVSL